MKDTRESIIEGARVVFAQKGFRATIKDIAKAAGLSSPSLVFWYFKDKEQLLLAVAFAASPFSHIDELLHSQKTADPLTQLELVANAYLEAYTDSLERQILFQLVGNSTSNFEIRQVLQQQISSVISGQVAPLIQRGQTSGQICRYLDAEFLAQAFLGTLYALVTRWEVNGHLPWSKETMIHQVMGLLRCQDVAQ